MSPIRRSNRARKPKVYWEPPSPTRRPPTRKPPTRKQQLPTFTIYTDPSEDLGTQSPEDLDTQFLEDLDMDPAEDLDTEPTEDLNTPLKDQPYQPQFLPKDRVGRP